MAQPGAELQLSCPALLKFYKGQNFRHRDPPAPLAATPTLHSGQLFVFPCVLIISTKNYNMEHEQVSHHHTGHQHEALINQLLACAAACENCGASCLDEQDVTPMAYCIELDRDCAEVCLLAARLLMRQSEFSHEFLAFCEKICRHCAKECDQHQHEHCKACATACFNCAEACHAHHHGAVLLT